jgi:hypothetical protein
MRQPRDAYVFLYFLYEKSPRYAQFHAKLHFSPTRADSRRYAQIRAKRVFPDTRRHAQIRADTCRYAECVSLRMLMFFIIYYTKITQIRTNSCKTSIFLPYAQIRADTRRYAQIRAKRDFPRYAQIRADTRRYAECVTL